MVGTKVRKTLRLSSILRLPTIVKFIGEWPRGLRLMSGRHGIREFKSHLPDHFIRGWANGWPLASDASPERDMQVRVLSS